MTHERVLELKKQGRNDEATKVCLDMLNQDRDDAGALFQLAMILTDDDNPGLAYNLLARAARIAPDVPEIWMQYGKAHPDLPAFWSRTEWCLRKAIKLADKKGRKLPLAWAQLGMVEYIRGNYDKAQAMLDRAFAIDPHHENAMVAQGFVHLAKGQWAEAWDGYHLLLKSHRREAYGYGDTQDWDGSAGKRIVVSGEQGIGDEILFASCFNRLVEESEDVVIDCMPCLQGLFRRSFPRAHVYGQRWKKEVQWEDDHRPEYHVAMATLPRFYLRSDEDFTGVPYLKADPDMRAAFRGMLADLGDQPKIGIAWTGGTGRTRGALRKRTLEELTPLLRQDAIWVSLAYDDKSAEIAEYYEKRKIPVHVFDWITRKGLNFDMTAALLAELDLVITVPTAIGQTAGALGVEAWVLVPRYHSWLWARDHYPWSNQVKILRNPSMTEAAGKLAEWLAARGGQSPKVQSA